MRDLGWDSGFEQDFRKKCEELDLKESVLPARVIGEERTHFRVITLQDQMLFSELSGQLKLGLLKKQIKPAVGDWVIIEPHSEGTRAIIHGILNRRTKLSRNAAGEATVEQILATNIDTAVILASLNQDFSVNRLQRYVAVVRDSGATPVILLTKSDQCEDPESFVRSAQKGCVGVEVHAISVVTGEGLNEVQNILRPGKTIVLLGSSGVGKSTLLNHFMTSNVQATREVREGDDKGRHTTTGRHLWSLPSGALVIDTPGMRELQLWVSEDSLDQTFEDIAGLALKCKFTDCSHENEPGCHVREAIQSGLITRERFENYQKMQDEVATQERRRDKAKQAEYRKGLKKLNKDLRLRLKEKGRK